MIAYENYHCHTYYSNPLTQPDSTMAIEDYAKAYAQRGQRVLCCSEHGNRSNVWQQFEVAQKYSTEDARMVPLAAAECYFVPDRDPEKKDDRNFHLILIAKDMQGFYELNEALSEANLTGFYRKARVDFPLLSRLSYQHFICTTACVAGPVRDPDAVDLCTKLKQIFRENLFLEVQHHPQLIQVEHNKKVLDLYRRLDIPLIYGTDSHYIRHEDAVLRKEQLLSSNIVNGYEDEFDLFLPTAEEAYQMLLDQKVLSKAQIEEAMQNTLQLRDFEGVHFTSEKKIPCSRPDLTPAQRVHLYKKECCYGYIDKAGMPDKEEAAKLHEEMDAVADTGTADYFIAMKDIVDKGVRYGGVLTTTGRGSGVSFATNYALGFTSINRLHAPVQLYPERFISKERLASGALPDLDLNMANVPAFEKAGKEILGEWGCLPMIAFGTNKVLSAFKLLARARDIDFETSNEISKQLKVYQNDLKHAWENNQDDPDYDANDDVRIEDYVDEKYLQIIEDSKQYQGIVTTFSPHPCAHLLLDRDIRREIGVVRVKSKSGNKDAVYAAYIDGATADKYGYLKADYLRVDVVKTIDAAFKACGLPVMSVDELLEKVKDDQSVWDLYANGFTMGLNQCEREKTTERVMQYKPRNVVELAAFIAAVRPGFKSMLQTFISRERFSYGIPSLDNLLQTEAIPDSFLMYDEQILKILQAAGIPPADAYACCKNIKKKKADKVASYKERFKTGFTKTLKEKEHASDQEAEEIVERIWTIINDAASYMFCAAHALSMACDSLYGAYLKAHFPYEFYTTMLKLYTEKGNKEKIALIVSEMKRYQDIRMLPGKFGQDNRDWYIDKANHTISQSLSSIKFMSQLAAEDLFTLGQRHFDSFTGLLRALQMETCVKKNQIELLIRLGYFQSFGGSGKLLHIFNEFLEGKNRLTKSLVEKTVDKRMAAMNEYEASVPDNDLPIANKLNAESEFMCICLSFDPNLSSKLYFVQEIDDQYGIKIKLYQLRSGKSGTAKVRKDIYKLCPLQPGQVISLDKFDKRKRCVYKDGKRIELDKTDVWAISYQVVEGGKE